MTADHSRPYVTGYEYDVFVGYAHIDNERGRVTTFVKELEVRLAEALGRPRPRVWMDHQIRGNEPLDQISAIIQRTAVFLLIRSPGYMKSAWCRREVLEFAGRYFGGGNRIFIAHVENALKDSPLPSLGDRPGYNFWVEDPETRLTLRLGYPET